MPLFVPPRAKGQKGNSWAWGPRQQQRSFDADLLDADPPLPSGKNRLGGPPTPGPRLEGAWAARKRTSSGNSEFELEQAIADPDASQVASSPSVVALADSPEVASEELTGACESGNDKVKVSDEDFNNYKKMLDEALKSGGPGSVEHADCLAHLREKVDWGTIGDIEDELGCQSDEGTEELHSVASEDSGEDTMMARDVKYWLYQMKLAHLRKRVVDWCEKMGACCLEEVCEGVELLCFDLCLEKREEATLKQESYTALELVRAAPVASEAAQLEAAQPEVDADVCLQEVAEQETIEAPYLIRRKRKQDRKVKSSLESSQLTSDTQRLAASTKTKFEENVLKALSSSLEDDRPELLKRAITDAEDLGLSNHELVERARDAHKIWMTKFEDVALNALSSALKGDQPESLERAISDAEDIGLASHELVLESRDVLLRLIPKHRQRRSEAVCALQHAMEAVRDDNFGRVARDALTGAPDALHVDGGEKLIREAERALRRWEEICMGLQLAIQRCCCNTLRVALEEARKEGLPPQHSLVAKAQQLLIDNDDTSNVAR